jgi:hypothetical protein
VAQLDGLGVPHADPSADARGGVQPFCRGRDDLGSAVHGDRSQPAVARGDPALRDAGGDADDLASAHDARLLCAEEEGRCSVVYDGDLLDRVHAQRLLVAGRGVGEHDADGCAVLGAANTRPPSASGSASPGRTRS